LVTIVEQVAACRDPTDDKFLELAINGRADLMVTGDLDRLVLKPFRGIPIITAIAASCITFERARTLPSGCSSSAVITRNAKAAESSIADKRVTVGMPAVETLLLTFP
jgi:hypothetical protein